MQIKALNSMAKIIRKDILEMSFKNKAPHIGCSLCIVDILTVLYFNIMRVYTDDPKNIRRDRFLLSKGHACSALYSALANKKFFPKSKLLSFLGDGAYLAGHPEIHSAPGIEASSGSLGHGLGMGVGMAIAGKLDKLSYKVFVLLSDGECDEGQVWEAALFAAQKKLDNLIAIVDYNKLQALGNTNTIVNLEPFLKKWEDFGWNAIEADGHNITELVKEFKKIPKKKGKPTVIIAHTIKGKGVSFMENDYIWHYKNLDLNSFTKAVKEI